MKLQAQSAVTQPQIVDITELFLDLKEQHRNVFIFQADNQVFIYRSLGRGEYRKILTNEHFDDMMKEEIICKICVLWPEVYDYDNCDAGIPTILARAILKNSYLDSNESRRETLEHYRQEMWDLDNQITCIINEAFPQFDIEEIEAWDIDKTTKYLSRAEWKLHNLRGLKFVEPQGEYSDNGTISSKQQTVYTEEIQKNVSEEGNSIRGNKKEKLTPEKLRQLKARFPEINWEDDNGTQGIDGLEQDSIDVVAPALRPGF